MSRHPTSASGTEHVARLTLDSIGISIEMPLDPIISWWKNLRERNRRVREIEDGGRPSDSYRFVHSCPSCSADFSHLTTVKVGGVAVKVCMTCRCEIGE